MGGPTKAIVAAVALAIAASTAYSLFAAKQKKDQQHAVATALGDTTVQLRKALSTAPSAEVVSRIDRSSPTRPSTTSSARARSPSGAAMPSASRAKPP
jgi:hypothetical protein